MTEAELFQLLSSDAAAQPQEPAQEAEPQQEAAPEMKQETKEETEEPAQEPEEESDGEEQGEEVKEEPEEEPAQEPEEEETPELPEGAALAQAGGEANVRTDADGLSAIFTSLPEGAQVVVLAVEGDWVKVEVDGQTGYMHIKDVEGLPEELLPQQPEEAPADPTANMKITIFSSRRTVMDMGEPVVLTSLLEGFEGYEVRYQWQCDDGTGYADVPGANDATYTFPASVENFACGWRLHVLYRPAR